MNDQVYQVSVQATSQDLTTATGSYDDMIDYGAMKPEDFWNVLQHFIRIQPFPHVEDQDYCPANITVEGPYGLFSLETYGDGQHVFMIDHGAEVTAEQAYHFITGQADVSVLAPQQPVAAAGQNMYQQQVMVDPGPSPARRWTGNILAGFFALLGILFAVVGLVQNKEGIVISIIVAIIFLGIFGGLAWFSRRVIGGIKPQGSGSSASNGENEGMMQGMMMAHMMNMNDSSASDSDSGGYDDGGGGYD